MAVDMKLVEKGYRHSRLGLLDQGRKQIELEFKYRGALRAAGWKPELTEQMLRVIDHLDSQHAELLDTRGDARSDTRREQAAIDGAKALKRKLVHAFDDLYDDARIRPEDHKIVKNSGTLGRSSIRISAYLADVRKQVEKHAPLLSEFFDGECVLTLVDNVKAELDAAQATQEVNLSALPLETLKVYELKGLLLTLIEKMNRRGKIAFDGQAEILALFNKDLLRRARKVVRAKSTVEVVGDAGEGIEEGAKKDAG